jgi:D-3-phosphoglycerate dehydrogenase / 2-oxoglutarate reductase
MDEGGGRAGKAWSTFFTHTRADFDAGYDAAALSALSEISDIRVNALNRRLTGPEVVVAAAGCQVIMTEGKTVIDATAIRDLVALVAVVRPGVEMRQVDVAAASANGVLVINTPVPEHTSPVAELTIGFMICLAKDVVNRAQALRAKQAPWTPMGMQLRGHVLGLVGFGQIGREVARIARTLGMRVCFTDPAVGPSPLAEKMDLPALLVAADFVSLHARWTRESERMIGERELRRMKPTAYLVNTARGALVDEGALERALREGWIAGAALDVVTNEPRILENPLLTLPNVIVTPHVAGYSPEAVAAHSRRTVEITRVLQGGGIPAGTLNASEVRHPRRLAPAAGGGRGSCR